MSALNVFVQKDSATVISDGAAYRKTGELTGAISKVLPMPQYPAAIGTRGHVAALAVFATALGMCFQDYDSMIDGIESIAPGIHADNAHVWGNYGSDLIELYLVGFSKRRDAFAAFTMRTEGANVADAEATGTKHTELLKEQKPFELVECGECAFVPAPDIPMCAQLGFAPTSIESINPELDGLRLLESQRQQKIAVSPGMPLLHYVGAFAQRTTVFKDRVEQRVFHRWPEDRVGELITPAPLDFAAWRVAHVPSAPVGMSRLKKQMLEKKANKARH